MQTTLLNAFYMLLLTILKSNFRILIKVKIAIDILNRNIMRHQIKDLFYSAVII